MSKLIRTTDSEGRPVKHLPAGVFAYPDGWDGMTDPMDVPYMKKTWIKLTWTHIPKLDLDRPEGRVEPVEVEKFVPKEKLEKRRLKHRLKRIK